MSSLYVRNTVRGWCRDPAMRLPFIDTVNVEESPPGPQWSTLAFVTSQSQTASYCGHMAEQGSFDYIALGVAGIGDLELIEAAEADVALLLQKIDPLGRLTLLRASPPEDFLQGGSSPWYTVSCVISYSYAQPEPIP